MNYALGAGDLFNVNDNSEYVETIIGNYLPSSKALSCWPLSYSLLHTQHFSPLNYSLMFAHFILMKVHNLSTIILCILFRFALEFCAIIFIVINSNINNRNY